MSKNRALTTSNTKLLMRLCDYAGKLLNRVGDYGFGLRNAISQIGNGYPQVIHIMRHSLYFTPWMRHSLYFWESYPQVIHIMRHSLYSRVSQNGNMRHNLYFMDVKTKICEIGRLLILWYGF